MVVGYTDNVNNIKVITKSGREIKADLGVNGLNIMIGGNYSYYDKNMLLHFIDMEYCEKILLYHNEDLVMYILQNGNIIYNK